MLQKNSLLAICCLLLSFQGLAQSNYYPGYFISNDGSRTICLINDNFFESNPKEFSYKLEDGGMKLEKSTGEVQEYGIVADDKRIKFIRAEVLVDRDSDSIDKLTKNRLPEWSKETLFLEVLVEGDANLFFMQDKNLVRYFFNTSNLDSIQQLVYRRYIIDEYNRSYLCDPIDVNVENSSYIMPNNTFRQQLHLFVSCENTHMSVIESLLYRRDELINYFQVYNQECARYTKYYGGYFIAKNGERVEGLIKDEDRSQYSKELIIKPSPDAEPERINMDDVQEFGFATVDRKEKYITAEVLIDKSSDNISNLSTSRLPNWQKEKLFLKPLVEGEANLYVYQNKDITRFFFNTSDQDSIQQLVYKKYILDANKRNPEIKEDLTFRQQLYIFINCWGSDTYKPQNVIYSRKSLESYFNAYNRKVS